MSTYTDAEILDWLSCPAREIVNSEAEMIQSWHTSRKTIRYMVNGRIYRADGPSLREAAEKAMHNYFAMIKKLAKQNPERPK